MRFKVGDKVIVTSGKDKGIKSEIIAVFPDEDKVLVKGANFYVKHVKPVAMINRPGERIRKERPMSVAKVAIINGQDQPDRIGYKVDDQGKKVRIFKKTGKAIPAKKEEKSDKKTQKNTTLKLKKKELQEKKTKTKKTNKK